MTKLVFNVVFGILIFHHVIAAPSEVKLEDIAEVSKAEESADANTPTLLDEPLKDTLTPQSQRRKRWYNYYGFPPVSPQYFNRDDSFNTGIFGLQDPLILIHRRLQDINNSIRHPSLPQFPQGFPQFPPVIPVFYIPQVGCGCSPDGTTQRPIVNKPTRPPPDNKNNRNGTDKPDIANRWPEMEDERQNWGLVSDNNREDYDDGGDGSRPISLEPLKPIVPIRPAPEVEHGSVDGNAQNGNTATTTQRPQQAPGPSGLPAPSNCDSAILRCCHLPQVTFDCFAYQGCADPSSYGNPCDSGVISRVIDRFLKFYDQKNG